MITENGYQRKTYQEILDGKIEKAKELFGEDIDTSDLTPLGKYIRINAYDQAEAEEEAEMVYYSIFPQTATGTSLDRLCAFVGISRNPSEPSTYTVDVSGTEGAVVPAGFLVGTESEVQFYNLIDTEIGADGCTITVECTEAGTVGNVNADEITVIVNPDANITGISNAKIVLAGSDAESDVLLRQRFMTAREGLGSCNENSIRAAILRVESVTSASVIANETNEEVDGRPPHSFECYVCGGEGREQEIGQAIFDKKPLGIQTYGDVSVAITDTSGTSHQIRFSRTQTINITVSLKIVTTAEFQGDTGITEIQNNIRDYINSLGVGNSVYVSSLYGKIHAVDGVVDVTSLLLSTDGGQTTTSGNVDITKYQTAKCTNVSVRVG